MKIVAISGSPRGPGGNTSALLGYLLAAAEEDGAQTQTIHLSQAVIRPCKACDMCHRTGKCPHDDPFEETKRSILAADGLVLASPNYIFSVSAQLKAFMDRCCGVIHCMAFRGRYGAAVVTSGGGEEAAVADHMSRFLMATGVVPVGSVWATMGGRKIGDIPDEVCNLARDLGRSLVRACRERTAYPSAEETIAAFEKRMRGVVEFHREAWPFEYAHWKALQETV
jgi:multimeric flavodoxin WrbA